MKRTSLLKTMLLLFALIAGGSSAWAQTTKTEGFENKATATNYQGTVTITETESDCGIGWEIYYGCVSTNDKISGSKSAQMRWYGSSDHVGNYPYIKTTTAIEGLSNVSLKARTSDKNVKMDVCYSADGSTWTVGTTHTFSKTGTGESVSLDIPSGNKYVKFGVSSTSTAPGSSKNYKLIIDDVVFTYSSSLVPASWSLTPASAMVVEGQSTTLQLTTNYDGTLTFTSNDTDVATVSYNSSKGEITVEGIAAGSTTISVTGAATSTYEAISKSIDVTVTYPEKESNATDVMGPLGYSYFGLTPEGESTYVQPDVTSTDKTDVNGVTISFAKAESSNKPRYDAAYTRFYNGNTLTVTAPAGATLRKIVFTEPATEKSWSGSMTPNQGSYVESIKTWFATTDDVTEVVLTNDATKRIGGMEVYLMMNNATIAPAKEYTTYVTIAALDFSGIEGLKAFVATTADDSGVTLEEPDGAVPAGTPLVLKKESGSSFSVPVVESAEAPAANLLVAGPATLAGDGTEYILSDGLFYKAKAGSLAAGKAYLKLTSALGRELVINWGGETAIQSIDNGKLTKDNVIYDLSGRRVENPTKGIFIINGKKVIIK